MIISLLAGGLGNQLYQYAAGRSVGIRRNVEFKLDCSEFRYTRLREYELHNFRIAAKMASRSEAVCCNPNRALLPIRLLRRAHLLKRPEGRIFQESDYHRYDPSLFEIPLPRALSGYWQSYRYFEDIRSILLDEFTPVNEANGRNRDMLDQIEQTESVFLHVRRGDYLTDPIARAMLSACSLEYYRKAVDLIAGRTKAPHLYIFSDDPEWTTQNLRFDLPTTFVTHNSPKTAFEDIRLMSACKHAVIANSTFSWWGAWLIKSDKPIIVAPSQWVNDASVSMEDTIPGHWITM